MFTGQERRARQRVRFFVSESDPRKFMQEFARGVAGFTEVFLCDPNGGAGEAARIEALRQMPMENRFTKTPEGWLMIPTGGSGGQLKFARHDEQTITAAVRGFTRHFGVERVNAVGVLPLHHVSGLMAWLRCALTGGEYVPLDWKQLEGGDLLPLPAKPDGWVISLVPTQLERLLRNPAAVAWLKEYRIIFLGGAAATPGLLDRAAALGLRLSPGYGMTETAAMVTALRPEDFLSGARSSGAPLPHARVAVAENGVVSIGGESLFRGYYPEWRTPGEFKTSDLGHVDPQGHLHVLGRSDAVIITGGEKVNPAEVERALRETDEFSDVVVVGVPDPEWGQAVVAAYPASTCPDLAKVQRSIVSSLSAYKRPKRYLPVENWPLNAVGKVNRAEVARLLS
ncbi:AMP-binding protein [Oleiharenicola lentus]|uniref:AMP-binding protein n=1 Tax=Oleiharenicola lentus TaxID=2508720 RepID=UPI001C553527|nr:AMP-binding protein [Oleiharenicola lentus]